MKIILNQDEKNTVASYLNENFSFNRELPTCLFPSNKKEVQHRGDGCKIGHSHLNEKLSFEYDATVCPASLFVFQRDDPQQNGVKLLTPVSDLVFDALSDGTIHFSLYSNRSLNHNLIS